MSTTQPDSFPPYAPPIAIPRGSTAKIRLTLRKGAAIYDVAIPGTIVIFTASLRGTKLFQHSYVVAGTTLPAGVTAGGITPNPSIGANVLEVQIASADTANLEAPVTIEYDAWLYTAQGDEVPVVRGEIRVGRLSYAPA